MSASVGAAEPYPFRGVPLSSGIAELLIKVALAEENPIDRPKLIKRVADLHRQRGGKTGGDATRPVKKALATLQKVGAVVSVSHGYWRLPEQGDVAPAPISDDELDDDADTEDEGVEPEISGPKLKLKWECEIGSGSEVAYVYYYENDKRLAKHENQPTWPCKVGFSTRAPEDRIIGQGAATALHSLPVIGLLIWTDDGFLTEKIIHNALRLAGRTIPNSPGKEWFDTTPEAVRQWFEEYQRSLRLLMPDHSQTELSIAALPPSDQAVVSE